MSTFKFLRTIIIALIVIVFHEAAMGQLQIQIKGTVYERSARFGLQGVSVTGTSGAGTITDSLGHYKIVLPSSDSISFSYLGKATQKIPVKYIPPDQPFDMTLQVTAESLPTVVVRQGIYRLDSLANRKEYQKAFNYERDYMADQSSGFGIGVSLDMLLDGKKARQMESLQKRLKQQEEDKYVDHRFNKTLVKRVTGMQSPALDTFMVQYRPSYETLKGFETEYEYYNYIRKLAVYFLDIWKQDHP